MDNTALFKLSYGLYVVGTKFGDKVNAQTANTVVQISAEPITVAIALNKGNYTNELVRQSGVFSVNVLSTEVDMPFIANFGFRSGRDNNKFADYKYVEGVTGAPLIQSDCVCATLEAEVISTMDAGTHTIFLGRVVSAEKNAKEQITYAMYHQLKNKAAAQAQPTAAKAKKGPAYRCTICGHVVEEGFEDLPDDWVCPICGAPKSMFVKIEEPEAPEPKKTGKKGKAYRCTICGYVVEEGFEDLPDDWVCPICGAPKSMFVPVEEPEEEPKKAEKTGASYQCGMCGHIVEEGFEDLPDDWVCPICGAPKSMFTEIPGSKPAPKKEAPKVEVAYKCDVCGHIVESGFDELPDAWVCPICGVSKTQFNPVE